MHPIPERVFRPVSLELGAGVRINRFRLGFRMDPIKAEVNMDVGVSLRSGRRIYSYPSKYFYKLPTNKKKRYYDNK